MTHERTTAKVVELGPSPRFDQFEKPSFEQWKEAAIKTLKGAPFDKKLLTPTPEGVTLEPIYDSSALEGVPHAGSLPGFAPFARGAKAAGSATHPWLVAQTASCAAPEEAGRVVAGEIASGSTAIGLRLDGVTRSGRDPAGAGVEEVGADGISLASAADLSSALGGVDPTRAPVQIQCGISPLPALAMLVSHARAAGSDPKAIRGWVAADPLAELAAAGRIGIGLDDCYRQLAAAVRWTSEHAPRLRTVAACGHPYHDAGASAVQELGLALCAAVEHVRALVERGVSAESALEATVLELSVGPRLFLEMAKLRAARVLWTMIADAWGAGRAAGELLIHARTSNWNATIDDPYVNMIRVTSEAFSAAVAGADSIETVPFDALVRTPNEFSRRIARNVQIVLREESGAGRTADPGGGSWHLEKLTDEIARRSWDLLREVEGAGGLAEALQRGDVQKRVAGTAEGRGRDAARRKMVMVGTNSYVNPHEHALEVAPGDPEHLRKNRIEAVEQVRKAGDRGSRDSALSTLRKEIGDDPIRAVEAAIEAAANGASIGDLVRAAASGEGGPEVEALVARRAAEPFERLRRRSAELEVASGSRPAVFLAKMGPVKQHKARADFSRGFFEVGGFEVIDAGGFDSPEEAAEAAAGSGARVAVLCSSDDTYPELVPPFARKLGELDDRIAVVLAGRPKDLVEELKEAGIDEFIHLGADSLELLGGLLDRIGAES
ncbi:MAG: methylmalonyl-CoA mutase family protein [Polyangia bacterium]